MFERASSLLSLNLRCRYWIVMDDTQYLLASKPIEKQFCSLSCLKSLSTLYLVIGESRGKEREKRKEERNERGRTKLKEGGDGGEATKLPTCIGYRISIKQTEIPWEKSHPAPLDWYELTAHEMNVGPRVPLPFV